MPASAPAVQKRKQAFFFALRGLDFDARRASKSRAAPRGRAVSGRRPLTAELRSAVGASFACPDGAPTAHRSSFARPVRHCPPGILQSKLISLFSDIKEQGLI